MVTPTLCLVAPRILTFYKCVCLSPRIGSYWPQYTAFGTSRALRSAEACLHPTPLMKSFCSLEQYGLFSSKTANSLTPLNGAAVNQSITFNLWETDACAADKTYFFLYNTCAHPVNVTYAARPTPRNPYGAMLDDIQLEDETMSRRNDCTKGSG